MKKQILDHDLFYRAQWSVMRDFDTGFFSAIRIADPQAWIDCDAREVALHVQSCGPDEPVYQVWHAFPGGFPRFLDMRDRVRMAAETEQGRSSVDWIPVAVADDVLKERP